MVANLRPLGTKGLRDDHTYRDTCEYPLDAYGIVNQIDVLMVMVNSSIGTFLYCASNKDFNALAFGSVKKCLRMRE